MTLLDNQLGLFREQVLGYRAVNLHLFLKDSEIDYCLFYLKIAEKHHGAE